MLGGGEGGCRHMGVAQATGGRTLANDLLVFPVHLDKLPKYGVAYFMACYLCTPIFIKC